MFPWRYSQWSVWCLVNCNSKYIFIFSQLLIIGKLDFFDLKFAKDCFSRYLLWIKWTTKQYYTVGRGPKSNRKNRRDDPNRYSYHTNRYLIKRGKAVYEPNIPGFTLGFGGVRVALFSFLYYVFCLFEDTKLVIRGPKSKNRQQFPK